MGRGTNLAIIALCVLLFTFATIEMRRTPPIKLPNAKGESKTASFLLSNPLMLPNQALVGIAAKMATGEEMPAFADRGSGSDAPEIADQVAMLMQATFEAPTVDEPSQAGEVKAEGDWRMHQEMKRFSLPDFGGNSKIVLLGSGVGPLDPTTIRERWMPAATANSSSLVLGRNEALVNQNRRSMAEVYRRGLQPPDTIRVGSRVYVTRPIRISASNCLGCHRGNDLGDTLAMVEVSMPDNDARG